MAELVPNTQPEGLGVLGIVFYQRDAALEPLGCRNRLYPESPNCRDCSGPASNVIVPVQPITFVEVACVQNLPVVEIGPVQCLTFVFLFQVILVQVTPCTLPRYPLVPMSVSLLGAGRPYFGFMGQSIMRVCRWIRMLRQEENMPSCICTSRGTRSSSEPFSTQGFPSRL